VELEINKTTESLSKFDNVTEGWNPDTHDFECFRIVRPAYARDMRDGLQIRNAGLARLPDNPLVETVSLVTLHDGKPSEYRVLPQVSQRLFTDTPYYSDAFAPIARQGMMPLFKKAHMKSIRIPAAVQI